MIPEQLLTNQAFHMKLTLSLARSSSEFMYELCAYILSNMNPMEAETEQKGIEMYGPAWKASRVIGNE